MVQAAPLGQACKLGFTLWKCCFTWLWGLWQAKTLQERIQTLIGIMVGSDLEPITAVADSVFEYETGAELFVRHSAPDLADK